MAAALGKSEANVSVIQHRALADLRRLLELSPDDQAAPRGQSRFIRRLGEAVMPAARERQP